MATFGWSYKSNASGSKRPSEQSRKVESWQEKRAEDAPKPPPLHPQSHSAETLTAGTQPKRRKYDPRAKIFVGNLDWETKEVTIAEIFSTFGEIEAVKVIKDHETGTSRGFAFITFCEVDSAVKCKTWCAYNHLKIDDRNVTVRAAERRQINYAAVEKRKCAEDNNPTLYWEYKWTEDPKAEVYGPYETSLMLQWSKAGYFDAGCWVREQVTKKSDENSSEPSCKTARLVDQSYSDSSDSEDDTPSVGDPEENQFVHVSEIDFSIFP
ncbi:RNA-binding motif protein, X-linked 2-like [Stylophora pistillata]|uniref:Cold-inducible RNA-binding protein n=1 Tax=Stylophora pistillata TaxID=50429 RepID=A0A2B4SSL6_STYPI|nr:RNA-binding motif protein, X-linked 2-like [Stylophora pistillata]PFX31365.1 Cold-inducible RNA-binding protein [Stylophora pistillata]